MNSQYSTKSTKDKKRTTILERERGVYEYMYDEPPQHEPHKGYASSHSCLNQEPYSTSQVQGPKENERGGARGSQHKEEVEERHKAPHNKHPSHHLLHRDG